MKILHTCKIFYPEISGVTSYVHEVAKRQASMGHEVAVLTWGNPADSGAIDDFAVFRVPRGSVDAYSKAIVAFMPDVVHAHSIWEHVALSADYATAHGKKLVLTMHGTFNFLSSSYNLTRIVDIRQFFKWCVHYRRLVWPGIARSAFKVIYLNEQEGKLVENLGVKQGASVKVSNAVDCELFSPRPRTEAEDQSPKAFKVLFVGRVQRQKGIFTLLKAMRALQKSNLPVRLDVVGVGPHLQRSREFVNASGLSEFVSFQGRVGRCDMPERYRASDLVVLPSENEPFSTVYLEAMACALPCIGLDEGGTPEIIDQESTGFLIKRNDWRTLASRMAYLCKHTDKRLEMGLKGRTKACERFNWESVAQRITEAYL